MPIAYYVNWRSAIPLRRRKSTVRARRGRISVNDRLQTLGIVLPPPTVPVAAFLPWVRSGNLVFLSGHIARRDGKPWVGQLGVSLGTEDGKAAARAVAIDLLGTL